MSKYGVFLVTKFGEQDESETPIYLGLRLMMPFKDVRDDITISILRDFSKKLKLSCGRAYVHQILAAG